MVHTLSSSGQYHSKTAVGSTPSNVASVQGEAEHLRLLLPQEGEQAHTISPDSEDNESPRETNPTTTTVTAPASESANASQLLGTLTPGQDESTPCDQSTQSMQSQGYSSSSPLAPDLSCPPSAPSSSHNSLDHLAPGAVTKSHNGNGNSSESKGRSVHASKVGTRSSVSMGRDLNQAKVKKLHSIPSDKDHLTDV